MFKMVVDVLLVLEIATPGICTTGDNLMNGKYRTGLDKSTGYRLVAYNNNIRILSLRRIVTSQLFFVSSAK